MQEKQKRGPAFQAPLINVSMSGIVQRRLDLQRRNWWVNSCCETNVKTGFPPEPRAWRFPAWEDGERSRAGTRAKTVLPVKWAQDLWRFVGRWISGPLSSERLWDWNTDLKKELSGSEPSWFNGGQWLHRVRTKSLSRTLNVCVELRWDHKLADREEHRWGLKDKGLGWGEGGPIGAMKEGLMGKKKGGGLCLPLGFRWHNPIAAGRVTCVDREHPEGLTCVPAERTVFR